MKNINNGCFKAVKLEKNVKYSEVNCQSSVVNHKKSQKSVFKGLNLEKIHLRVVRHQNRSRTAKQFLLFILCCEALADLQAKFQILKGLKRSILDRF